MSVTKRVRWPGDEAITVRELSNLIADALYPNADSEAEHVSVGAVYLSHESEFPAAIRSGAIKVRNSLTMETHTFTHGAMLWTSVVLRKDVCKFLAEKGIGIRRTAAEEFAAGWDLFQEIDRVSAQLTHWKSLIPATPLDETLKQEKILQLVAEIAALKQNAKGQSGNPANPVESPLQEERAPTADKQLVENSGPTPLTTGDVAFCFDGLRWSEKGWKKPLGDLPKWLEKCIAMHGQRGVRERRWNPVLIAAALVRDGHIKTNSARARFQTKPHLQPWLEIWKTYEADNFDTSS